MDVKGDPTKKAKENDVGPPKITYNFKAEHHAKKLDPYPSMQPYSPRRRVGNTHAPSLS